MMHAEKARKERRMEAADEGVERVVDSKDLQQQSKALDKFANGSGFRAIWQAMASISAAAEADRNAMRMRERELAYFKINASDVDINANELEVAERTLREHFGDAVAAIRDLLR